MPTEFFTGVTRWNVERNGTGLPLPLFYYDTQSFTLVYSASTSRVQKLIPHPDLHLIELTPGRCLIAFAAFRFRKSDRNPYDEVGIAFFASHHKRPTTFITLAQALRSREIPAYVWQLPITTEEACAGSVNLFGFPSYLADIAFSKDTARVHCSLSMEGKELLNFSGRILPTHSGKTLRYLAYTLDGNSLLSANLVINPIEFTDTRAGSSGRIFIGNGHPMCDILREIELSPNPIYYQYVPRSETILFPARNMMDK